VPAAIVGAATSVDCAGLAACAVPIANAKAAAKAKLVTMIAGLFDALSPRLHQYVIARFPGCGPHTQVANRLRDDG
jgi:hypothetical protein